MWAWKGWLFQEGGVGGKEDELQGAFHDEER